MNKYICCTALIALLLSSGCASVQKTAETALPAPKAQEEARQTAEVPENGKKAPVKAEDHRLPDFKRAAPEKALPPFEPIDPKKVIRAEGSLALNAENMPLSDFIIYALGDLLQVTFFMDEQVKNTKDPVTFRMAGELPADKVFDMVTGVLEKKNLIIEEKAGALYILKARTVAQKPVDIRAGRDVPSSPAEVLQVVPLRYLKAQEAAGLIGDLYKTGVTIKIYFRENALLLSGQASSVKEVMSFIETFDVPYVEGRKAFIIKLTYWQTEEFIKQMTQILDGTGFGVAKFPKDSGIYFIPIKVLNSILVLAPDDISSRYLLEWKERLDTADSAGTEEKSYTFTPRYSKASDLVESLKKLYTTAAPAASKPAAQGQPAAPALQTAAVIIGTTRIAADDRRNIVLISASPSEYRGVLRYLETLDVPPKQVLVEVTIAELTLKDDLSYGLEWYIKDKMSKGEYSFGTLDTLGIGSSGFVYNFVTNSQNFQAVLNLFAKENRINIISTPRLMVLDNEESTIQIGTDVPVISGETKSTSAEQQTTVSTQSVQYRSTGLILKVKPTINTAGLLTLSIALESSEAQTNTLSSVDSPIILTRRLNTIVLASTGQSILLGGLMSENISETETKVPLLGDIPILGNAFKTTSKGKTKTELMIMIRPVIITNSEEAAALTNELKQEMKWFR